MPVMLHEHGPDAWLVLVLRATSEPRLIGRDRRRADEHAADQARRIGLVACCADADRATVSSSHTEGSAAVLVSISERVLGVDLVRISRIAPIHSRAILSFADWTALGAIASPWRGALGWALKEAAAKATGAAQHYFPTGVLLIKDPVDGCLRARLADTARTLFDVRWLVVGDLLCATVVASRPASSRRAHAPGHTPSCSSTQGV